MIEVVSIPEKRDKVMILIEIITYFLLVFFALLSDLNLLSIIISLASASFYLFRSKYISAGVSMKAGFIGILSFLTLQFWFKCNNLTIIDHGMEIDRTTVVEFASLNFLLILILSILKEGRENYLQLLKQKTANKS